MDRREPPMPSPLADAITSFIDAQGGGEGHFPTAIEWLTLVRCSRATLLHMIYKPTLCIVAQGAKQVTLGEDVYDYHALQYLLVSLEMPLLGRVTRASADEPYLSLALDFDSGMMHEVMDQLDECPTPNREVGAGVFVDDLDAPLNDCVLRLLRLLATPRAIPVLAPSILREICFWVLTGPHAEEVCKFALPDGHTQRIAKAICTLRRNLIRPIRVDRLAATARMSRSSFHEHFKALTSMTPLQYQKQLRLLEARRLMLADDANATSAAYQVGYESPSQFSREYARMFGAPPRRDVTELRASSA
jgi:AraC-like DNA-binding protein